MYSAEILIPVIIVAAVFAGGLYWRSKKKDDVRLSKQKESLRGSRDPLSDPAVGARAEPAAPAAASPAAAAPSKTAEAVEPIFAPDVPPAAGEPAGSVPAPEPSAEPPLYRRLEEEEEAQARAEMAAAAAAEEASLAARDAGESDEGSRRRALPPVDPAIQWVLDIAPREGMQFALGGVKSLKIEVERLQLPLAVQIWAQSSKDGLYYESDELTAPARHVVAALVLANRAARLDEVSASRFFQVLEQSAAQNEVALRREMEPEEAVKRSAELKRFIEYFDRSIEIRIAAPEGAEGFSLEKISAAAEAAGFTSASGRWELRADPAERDPVMTLAFGSDGTQTLTLALSLPLANAGRGDLKRFFALANGLSCTLGSVWTDCSKRPIDAGGAMLIQDSVRAHAQMIARGGVVPGSERARMLFSC